MPWGRRLLDLRTYVLTQFLHGRYLILPYTHAYNNVFFVTRIALKPKTLAEASLGAKPHWAEASLDRSLTGAEASLGRSLKTRPRGSPCTAE